MTRTSFIPAVTPNAVAIINSKSDDTYFIMEQKKPDSMFDPEEIDLQPHCIRSIGTLEQVTKWCDVLVAKINWLHAEETVEIFRRGEGRDYLNMVVFKGTEVVTLTICTKEKAKALAF